MIKAIDTRYNGYKFRSRLEARWAVYFDSLGIRWEYEMEGFDLGGGDFYLPDFLLTGIGLRSTKNKDGLWVEIKPPGNCGSEKLNKLVEASKHDGLLIVGTPGDQWQYEYGGTLSDAHYQYKRGEGQAETWWDNCMYFMKCYNNRCGEQKVEFLEGNYCRCEVCGCTCDEKHPDIIRAIERARSARFEHGQNG